MHAVSILVFVSCLGAEPAASSIDVRPAVERSLAWLTDESLRWREERTCASCHHVPLTVWSLQEARTAGFVVDEAKLDELTTWLLTSPDAKVIPEPGQTSANYNGIQIAPVMTAFAMWALPEWDDAARDAWSRIVVHVGEKQLEDGSFVESTGRPPIFGRPEIMTAYAALALSPPVTELAQREDAAALRTRSLEWLSANQGEQSHQALVLRLLLAVRAPEQEANREPLVAALRQRQNEDGGWSQIPDMPSDALATGQTLYALAAAYVPVDDPAVQRGVNFLLSTQRETGEWPMTSRPTLMNPDGGPANNLLPITAAGTAWGTLGLIRSGARAE
jgi:hypothetical protein